MTVKTWIADLQSLPLKDFVIQSKDVDPVTKLSSRVTLIDCARTGKKALMLTTQLGDTEVVNSGLLERCDIYNCQPDTAPLVHNSGDAAFWFAHSILFPDTFQFPHGETYVVADFHDVGSSKAANFHVNFVNGNYPEKHWGKLSLQRFTGDPTNPTAHVVILGLPVRNVWYDFVYHIKPSDKDDGYFYAWLNGQLVMAHEGPTLYPDKGMYWKCANYHLPISRYDVNGLSLPPLASSVIHDRIRRGATRSVVEAP